MLAIMIHKLIMSGKVCLFNLRRELLSIALQIRWNYAYISDVHWMTYIAIHQIQLNHRYSVVQSRPAMVRKYGDDPTSTGKIVYGVTGSTSVY